MQGSHSIAAGMVHRGIIVPNTEFVLRDSRAWWQGMERGTRRRTSQVRRLCGHWTGGPARVGPDAARLTVRNMKARKRPDGTPMEVAIHFIISWDGMVFQTCDLEYACVHVGSRQVNDESVGVECSWPGTYAQAQRLGIDGHSLSRRWMGRTGEVFRPSEPMLDAWARLADALAFVLPIPRKVPDGREQFSKREQALHRGGMEHYRVFGTEKRDASGLLEDALVERAFWKRG
jgi:hypothetical protein